MGYGPVSTGGTTPFCVLGDVKELLPYGAPALNTIECHLGHLSLSASGLAGGVVGKVDGELSIADKGTRHYKAMDFIVLQPPVILAFTRSMPVSSAGT